MQIGQVVTIPGDQQQVIYSRSITRQLFGVQKGNKQSQHQQLKRNILRSLKQRKKPCGFGTYSKNWGSKTWSLERQFFIPTIKEQSDLQSILAHTKERNISTSDIT